jgi:hypothetical protein
MDTHDMPCHPATAVTAAVLLNLSATGLAHAAGAFCAPAVDLGKFERAPFYGIGGGATEDEASANAMKFCVDAGGTHCKLQTTYEQCGSYAASQTSGGWGKAASKDRAEVQALQGCGEAACKIVVTDCNDGAK